MSTISPSNSFNFSTAEQWEARLRDTLTREGRSDPEQTANKAQNVWEKLGIAAGDFLAVQDGSSIVRWGESHLENEAPYRDFSDSTHIATVIGIDGDKIRILHADPISKDSKGVETGGVRTETLTSAEFIEKFVKRGKAGIAVIKMQNENEKDSEKEARRIALAAKIQEVAKGVSAQFDPEGGGIRGGYAFTRYIKGVLQDFSSRIFGTIHSVFGSNRRLAAVIKRQATTGSYELLNADGSKKKKAVCSELACAIVKTAQAAVAIDDANKAAVKLGQPQLDPRTITPETIAEWTKNHEIINLNEKVTTPSAFAHTLVHNLGFHVARVITPDDVQSAERWMQRRQEAEGKD